MGVRLGWPHEWALRGLTINAARFVGIDERVGSLEVGKDADMVVLSGDPLSVYTNVLETWVEGSKVFDRSDPKDYLVAVGGFGAGNDEGTDHIHCFDGDIGGEN
jgi:adenine deaminase